MCCQSSARAARDRAGESVIQRDRDRRLWVAERDAGSGILKIPTPNPRHCLSNEKKVKTGQERMGSFLSVLLSHHMVRPSVCRERETCRAPNQSAKPPTLPWTTSPSCPAPSPLLLPSDLLPYQNPGPRSMVHRAFIIQISGMQLVLHVLDRHSATPSAHVLIFPHDTV